MANKKKQTVSILRIIGGVHRGRKLSFVAESGLRPTGDRVRETLFNWLRDDISGARCLDLFAGSGAIGFEALSRGAEHVTFVDSSRKVVQQIADNLALLGLENAEVFCSEAIAWLHDNHQAYNVVFLDPPFEKDILAPVITALEETQTLDDGALIYVETRVNTKFPVPGSWSEEKNKISGQVNYRLYRYQR